MFDIGALIKLAQDSGGVIVMACAVGDTLVDGAVLLDCYLCQTKMPEHRLRDAIYLERERTFEQDPKYPIRLLVDIAIRALSAAINDPTTAVQTIDQIEDLLRRLARKDLDIGTIVDAHGVVRLVIPVPTWEDYLALAFDEIRQYGANSVQVLRRLRSALFGVADSLTSQTRVQSVQRYLQHLDSLIEHSSFDIEDRSLARQEDPQGIGLSRKRQPSKALMSAT
jgi:uncharacterized membrane protein